MSNQRLMLWRFHIDLMPNAGNLLLAVLPSLWGNYHGLSGKIFPACLISQFIWRKLLITDSWILGSLLGKSQSILPFGYLT